MVKGETMQHVMFGAGLIGGYLAGAMINGGLNVSLVARPSVQAKLGNGLHLTDYENHSTNIEIIPFITDDKLRQAPGSHACDYLWITVKCTAVDSSLADLPALVGPNTVIFCVQNGLGSEQSVKAKLAAVSPKHPRHNISLKLHIQSSIVYIYTGRPSQSLHFK